mgnify:CR=1 FL=1
MGISRILNNIGVIFYEMHDYNKALEYYQKSFKINKKLNHKKEISKGLSNMALIYEKQNNTFRQSPLVNMKIKKTLIIGISSHFSDVFGQTYYLMRISVFVILQYI